jgi:hypothetical protein
MTRDNGSGRVRRDRCLRDSVVVVGPPSRLELVEMTRSESISFMSYVIKIKTCRTDNASVTYLVREEPGRAANSWVGGALAV